MLHQAVTNDIYFFNNKRLAIASNLLGNTDWMFIQCYEKYRKTSNYILTKAKEIISKIRQCII